MFKTQGILQPGGITGAKWLDYNSILCGLEDGTVWVRDIRKSQRNIGPLVFRTDSAVRDLQVLDEKAFLATDAGEVLQIDLR